MAYIGNSPANVGNYQIIDDISGSFDGSQTSFALASGGASMTPTKSSQLIVNISGVMQQPDDSATHGFLVNSNNIVFSSAPLAADTFWGVYQGQSVDIGTPSDDVVDTIHIKDGAITGAKIAAGTVVASDIADDAVTEAKLANSINTAIAANTAKTGITTSQANAITANTAKTGITSGQATAITAALPKAGGTVTGNILHNDNIKNIYGTGTDANIYSDGQNLIIEGHNADSEVQITSDDRVIIGSKGWGESFAIFNDDGAVSLYYDNTVKFATTSAGATVTGKLGIGETSPTGQLHIKNTSGTSGFILTRTTAESTPTIKISTDSTSTSIENWGAGLVFKTSATSGTPAERMKIEASGRVGIGTSSPANKFVVAEGTGQHGVEIAPGTLSYIQAYDRATSDYGDLSIDAQTIRFGTDNGAERMRIDSSGKVGIGNSIASTFSGNANTLVVGSGSGDTGMTIYSGNTSDGAIFFADSADNNEETRGGLTYDHNTNKMQLRVNDANRLEIMSDGNVGIGTGSPSKTLSVHSTTGSAGTPNGLYLYNEVHGSDSQIYMYAENDSGSNQGANIKLDPDAETFSLIGTGGQTAITIADSGRVGIGTAGNLLGSLTVFNGDNFSTASAATSDNIYLISDATSGDGVYGASISFSRVQYPDRRGAAIASVQQGSDEDNVGLAFFTHPSATATDPLVEAMRIDASGALKVNGGLQIATGTVVNTGNSGGTLSIQGGATYPGGKIRMRGGQAGGDFTVYTGASTSSPAEALTITSDGRGVSQFTAKNWINYDGAGNSIRDSHNISSVTDRGTGQYTVNFDVDMANAQYCALTGQTAYNIGDGDNRWTQRVTDVATGSARIVMTQTGVNGFSYQDASHIFLTVFGD